jgi:hypothetical protein
MREVLMFRKIAGVIGGMLVLLVAIQLIPYGRNHTNPPVQAEPKWNNPATRDLAVRACFDCHSNQTTWPWYSNIAPVSWLVQHDVEEARGRLNISEWNLPQRQARGAGREVQQGRMPQWYYVLIHPGAKLSSQETQALIQGLNSSLPQTP